MAANDAQRARCTQRRVILVALACALIVAAGLGVGLAVGLVIGLRHHDALPTSARQYRATVGRYRHGAVAADASICSQIGTDIMAFDGGSAVDAAIAASVCTGVYNMHSTGVGGGGIAVVYSKANGTAAKEMKVFDFREKAPIAATTRMFVDNDEASTLGGLSIAVPSMVKGYVDMHEKYGKIAWYRLFHPSIQLCKKGFPIGPPLARAIEKQKDKIYRSHNLRALFTDGEGNLLKAGDVLKCPKMAETLSRIAIDKMSFYSGELADDIVADLREEGSIITKKDLSSYTVAVRKPVMSSVGENRVYSAPPPSCGALILYMLHILKGYNMTSSDLADDQSTLLTYHRVVEAMKFAYAKRSEMGDMDFVNVSQLVFNLTSPSFGEGTRQHISDKTTFRPEHYGAKFDYHETEGTSHLSVVDADGNAVSLTTTINLYLGSKVKGTKTGIIFNNEMDDFSTPGQANNFGVPPSKANFIEPGKRPLSSQSPTIVLDKEGEVKMVLGASGGTRIPSGIFMVMFRTLVLGQKLGDAIDATRIHHQLAPNNIRYDAGLSQTIEKGLRNKGHELSSRSIVSVVQAIQRVGRYIFAASDDRKNSLADGY